MKGTPCALTEYREGVAMLRGIESEEWQAGLQRGGFLAKLFQRYLPGNRRDVTRGKGSEPAREATVETVTLSAKELRVLEISQYGTISCLEGTVWITFPHRFCDYILKAGESISLRGEGRLVVSGGCRRCIIGISAN